LIFGDRGKSSMKYILVVALLGILLLTFTGCEDFGLIPASTPTPEASAPEEVIPPAVISTADRAILAVYEYLLGQAGSHEAKKYLAEFYAVSENWSAEKERFNDGSSIWYVQTDTATKDTWEWTVYWQQAGWFVLQDGKVMPSYRLRANALRIEADLQELSLSTEMQISKGT